MRVVILEFFRPAASWTGRTFRWYFRHVLPRVGRMLSGAPSVDAYRYLPESVEDFAAVEDVREWLAGAGLEARDQRSWTQGAVTLLVAEKPREGAEPQPARRAGEKVHQRESVPWSIA